MAATAGARRKSSILLGFRVGNCSWTSLMRDCEEEYDNDNTSRTSTARLVVGFDRSDG